MRFGNHFLILIFLNTTLRQYFKDCNIFQRACSLACLRTLPFTTPKKSNAILFLPIESFSCLRFCHFPRLSKILYSEEQAKRLVPNVTIFFKLPPNSGHLSKTDKFFKTRGCPLFRDLLYGKAEWQCIKCQIAAEIIGISFSSVIVVSFRQQCDF